MVMKFLRTAKEVTGEFFADFSGFFSDPLLQYDVQAQVRSMLEKQGFKLRSKCEHESCANHFYIKGKGERRELFVVGTIGTFYKGRWNLEGQEDTYRRCVYADKHGGCSIPSIDGEGKWIPTIDLPRKLKKYF